MQALLVFHNIIRWFILLFGLWTILSAIKGLVSRKEYTAADSKSNFFFMLAMDIQLLIGLVLYFNGAWFESLKHIGVTMKEPMMRFFTVEHSILMIIAWILVHAGRMAVKKAPTSASRFKKTLVYFGIAFLLILIAIPWPFREAVSRPLFRWF